MIPKNRKERRTLHKPPWQCKNCGSFEWERINHRRYCKNCGWTGGQSGLHGVGA